MRVPPQHAPPPASVAAVARVPVARAAPVVRAAVDPHAPPPREVFPAPVAVRRSRAASTVAWACLIGFVALFGLVRARRSEALDLAVTLQFQANRHPTLDRLMRIVSWPGFPPQSRLIPPLGILALLSARLRVEAAFFVAAWGTSLLSTVVKAVIRRPRPVAGERLRVVVAPLGGSSFPSGHVLSYVGLYGFAAYLADVLVRPVAVRRALVGALLVLVALVGTQQNPAGPPLVHRRDCFVFSWHELRRRAGCVVSAGQGASCGGPRMTAAALRKAPPKLLYRTIRNPHAGTKKGIAPNAITRDAMVALLERHGLGSDVVETAGAETARREARRAVGDGIDVVIAAGGDGTISAIASELLGSDVALGVMPLGSVMNIPRMLGIPRDLEAAATALASGELRRIDVGEAQGRPFYEAASVGMNAAMFREANRFEKGDWLSILRTIWVALRYRPARMHIELDGVQRVSTRALMVVMALGPYTGAGMTVAPEARLDDGKFDVRIFRGFSKPELIRHLAGIAFGRYRYVPHVSTYRASRVRVTSHRPLPCRADLRDLGTTPLEISVLPRALGVIVPRTSPS